MSAELSPLTLNRRVCVWGVGATGVVSLALLSLTVSWIAPLVLVACVCAALAFLRWPWLGCALLIVSVPVQQLGAVGPLTFTRASIPIALAGYLIWITVTRRTLVLTRYTIPFGLWLLWMLVTVSVADNRALAGAELARWAIAFGAFSIVAQFLIGAPRVRIVAVVAFMAFAGAMEATIGTILSLLAVGPESFQVGDAFSRAFGTFGRPNTFAGYLEMTIFPVAWLAVDQSLRCWPRLKRYLSVRRHGMVASQNGRRQIVVSGALLALLAGSSAIMLAGITASYSRGAWLGVAVGATFSALLFLRRAWLLVVAALPIVLVLLVTALSSFAPAALTDRLTSITDELRPFDAAAIPITDANFAVVERMAHWQAGWRMFEDAPLTGVGVGNFNEAYPEYFVRTEFRFSQGHAHNYYIHVLAETGVVGLVLYLTLMLGFLLLATFVAWSAPTGTARMIALGAVGSLTAVMVHNLFENLHVLNLGIQISALWALALCAHDRWRIGERTPSELNMEYST